MTQTRSPVHKIRLGVVKAAIWANETEVGPKYNVTRERLDTEAKDRCKNTHHLGRDEWPVAAQVLDRAHSWIGLEAKGPERQIAPNSTD